MTRIEILKANGIEMIVSKDRKKRAFKNNKVFKEFRFSQVVKIEQLEVLFGEIEFREFW